jgi:hypothetical protein
MSAGESFGASAVKVAAVTTGAAMSGMTSISQAVGVTGQELIWFVTFLYGALQIVKAIPWFTDQSYAFWRGVRHGDWARWWHRYNHNFDGLWYRWTGCPWRGSYG